MDARATVWPSVLLLFRAVDTLTDGLLWAALSWPLGVLALLVALSRVILGLHYPNDVLIGGAIGALSAWGMLTLL